MSIVAGDLIFMASANMPETDGTTTGGAISTTTRVEFTDIAATDTVQLVSDNGSDTVRTVTVTGRDSTGAIVSEQKTLTGTTPVNTTQTYERILKAVASAGHATWNISVKRTTGAVLIGTIPASSGATITTFRRMFYDASSAAGEVIRYEKVFAKNNHGSLTLNSAQITLTADPSATVTVGCEASVNGTQSCTNRITAPDPVVTFVDDSVAQNVPTGALATTQAIGVWVKFTLSAAHAPVKNNFTLQLSGTTV